MNAKNNTHRNDILILAALLLAGAILYIIINSAKTDGARVDVVFEGEIVASYALGEDMVADLRYNGYNRLKIEDGKASITQADCPDKLCMKQKKASKEGDSIVCLPHRMVVKISGGDESDFDGVVK